MAKERSRLFFFGGHSPCAKCRLRMEFTGAAPENPSEALIEKIVRGRRTVPLHWLEEQVAQALYETELRQGGSAIDIGLWSPAVFREESARLLAEIRPQFGYLKDGSS